MNRVLGLFAWYLHIGLKANSVAQAPESFYKEKTFVASAFVALLMAALLFLDRPRLHVFLKNTFGAQ